MPIQAIDDARIARFTPPNLSAENRERLRIVLNDRLIDPDELETAWNLVSQTTKGSPQQEDAISYARTVQSFYVDQHMRGALAAGRTADTFGADLGFAVSPFDKAGTAAYVSGLNEGGLMTSLSAMSPGQVATIVDRLSGFWGRANPDFSREKLALTMMKYEGHIPLNRDATNQLWSSLSQSPREQEAFGQWLRQNASRAPK